MIVMRHLWRIAIQWTLNLIYLVFLIVGMPWMVWRVIRGKNRTGWGQKLWGLAPATSNPNLEQVNCLWFHAVSVGEVNLLEPIIDRLLEQQPKLRIAISTTTATGFELARKKYASHEVFFCPFDFSWAIKRVLRRLKPAALVLAELELWPNLISVCSSAQVPVLIVNGRLGSKSFRGYQRFGWFTRPLLRQLTGVAAQDTTIAQRFKALGCHQDRVVVTGSVKFDGVDPEAQAERTQELAALAGITARDTVLIAGSTQLEEDLMVAEVFLRLRDEYPRLKVILAPRHPDRCVSLGNQLAELGIESTFRSQLPSDANPRFLIVDVIGELGAWWGRADVAYVGGSMGKREGQNMIEPAAYAVPLCFGPRTRNFRDVVDQLLAEDAAVVVRDAASLESFVVGSMSKRVWAKNMGQRARQVVLRNQGAAAHTAQWLTAVVGGQNS